jgi:hypothetical protein
MQFSIVVLKRHQITGDADFLVREIERHFRTWQRESKSSRFKLQWIGSDLVLTTNSLTLVNQWLEAERGYVEHMLDMDSSIEVPEDFSGEFLYPSVA